VGWEERWDGRRGGVGGEVWWEERCGVYPVYCIVLV